MASSTSGSLNLNNGYQSSEYWYHTSPTIGITINWTCSRDNERTQSTHWTGTVSGYGRQYGTYGYTLTVRFKVNGTQCGSGVIYGPGLVGHSFNINGWVNIPSNSATITVEGECTAYGNCNHYDYSPGWSNGYRTDTASATVPTYNPYTAPQTYNITSFQQIKKLTDNRTLTYTISGGTGNIDWVKAQVYPENVTWNAGKYSDVSSAVKNTRIYESSSFFTGGSSTSVNRTDTINLNNTAQVGKKYKLAIRFSDNSYEWISSADKIIYVYQQPTLSTTVTGYSSPASANKNISFTLSGMNNRAFSDANLEQIFKTQYRVNSNGGSTYGSWTDLDTATLSSTSKTYTFNATTLRTLFPYATSDGKSCKIQFRRYSPSSGLESSYATATFTLYYKPRQGVTSVSYKKNNNSGTSISAGQIVINDSSLTGIYVSWASYDTTTVNAGITSGYRLRVYDKNGTLVKTYTDITNKYYTVPKADIPKLQNTQIDVTPYYKNGSTYVYYDSATPTKFNFVKLIGALDTPVITYPVDSKDWINRQIRICFQMPTDQDVVSGAISSTDYLYENIEIKVNNRIYTMVSGTTGASSNVIVAPEIFSTTTLSYKVNEVVVPNIAATLPVVTGANTVAVRVKKKKFSADEGSYLWSEWSATRKFNVVVPSYSPADGNSDPNVKYIRAAHYNNIISIVERASATYGITWSANTAQANTTVIQQNQFKYDTQTKIFKTIVDIKNAVNDFGTFDNDKQALKFDNSELIPANFTTYEEYVTELAESSGWTSQNPTGRNYLQIAFDRVTALL